MAGSKLWGFLAAILATAETTIPIFIHNPQAQKIEGVVITEANSLFATLAAIATATPAPAPGQPPQ